MKSADHLHRQTFSGSEYFSVRLPDCYDDTVGYHVQCYQNFTAVPHRTMTSGSNTTTSVHHLPSKISKRNKDTSNSAVFPRLCMFCDHYYKSVGRNKPKEKLGSCESLEKAKSMIKAAKSLCDDCLSSKILSVDLITKKAKYHHSCCRSYLEFRQREHQSEHA